MKEELYNNRIATDYMKMNPYKNVMTRISNGLNYTYDNEECLRVFMEGQWIKTNSIIDEDEKWKLPDIKSEEDILESRIQGEADIIFGGKIGSITTELKDIVTHNIVLRIGELKEKHEVGEFNNSEFADDFQVNMIFTNPNSIDAVIGWLEVAKEELNNKINNKEKESNE